MKESNDSVRDEQFGKTENTEKNDQGDQENADTGQDVKQETTDTPDEPAGASEASGTEVPDEPAIADARGEKKEPVIQEPEEEESEAEEADGDSEEDADAIEAGKTDAEADTLEEDPEGDEGPEPLGVEEEKTDLESQENDKASDELSGSESEKATEVEEKPAEPTPPKFVPEQIDYTKLSKEDLVKVLKDHLDTGLVNEVRKQVEAIKSNFYKKHKAEVDQVLKKFLTEGGQIQDFKLEESPVEIELKELLNKYRDLRSDLSKKVEDEKDDNLNTKLEIIDKIKELINSQESLNKTFHDFRELQNQWREVGPVPQSSLKDLWESYHYHVEAFYDYIKINKELRDLDFKKNFEAKIKLCESAEELLLEPSVVEAFRKLQKLHDQWREIGPVPIEKRSELWERFKEATTKINRKHQEYFVNLKQEQKKNYEEKLVLCDKAEEISNFNVEDQIQWEEKSKELIELQKVWKKIGFAPKKYNTQVYERFRKACDSFFEKKREHYSQNRDEQQNNLQLKTELCIQAEGFQNSTDWKKTTSDLISLQKKWKEIGPVPVKQSEKIWKRFRGACDTFFNNKSEFYSHIDTRYEDNLDLKNKLIEEIEKFELTKDVEKNLETLKDFQRRWSDIGYVPIKVKDEIQDRYRDAINLKFDSLKLDDTRKALLKFRNRIEGIISKPNAQQRLRLEREKCFTRLKQAETDITLWENNIGFFANTENAESMIQDVQARIESTRKKIEQLKGKIRMMDEYED